MSEVAQTLQHESKAPDTHGAEPMIFSGNSVGEKLAFSRQQKNWTVQYVAEQLKLSQGQINALESNQFNLLPQLVIVRGFVRAYAKLLKIDPDSLVTMLPREAEPVQLETALRPALSTPFIDSRLSLQGQNEINRAYIWGAVGLTVVAMVFAIFQRTEFGQNLWSKMFAPKSPVVADVAPPSLPPQNAGDQVLAPNLPVDEPKNGVPASGSVVTEMPTSVASSLPVQAVEVVASESKLAIDKASVSSPNKNVESVATSKALAATNVSATVSPTPVKPMVSAAPASNGATNSSNVASTDKLVLKFRQDSWVQVKTEAGTILSSHLARAGSEEVFGVKQALQVKLGNAAGVDATLRGEAMPVVAERDSKVANFVVK